MKPVRIIGSGSGEVLEWLIRPVSKTGKPQKGFVGSNPTLSANSLHGATVEPLRKRPFAGTLSWGVPEKRWQTAAASAETIAERAGGAALFLFPPWAAARRTASKLSDRAQRRGRKRQGD